MNKRHLQYKHIFFDFDGTLCASEPDIRNGWKNTMAAMGLENPDFDRLFQVGPSLPDMTRILFPDLSGEKQNEIVLCFKRLYDTSELPFTRPYPWIPAWLEELKSAGCSLYVVTNKRKVPTEYLLARMDWNRLFTASCSPDSFGPENLSKAQMIAKFLKDFNIPLEEAVMVGDTSGDINAGKANHIAAVGVSWGYGNPGELEKSPCDLILSEKDFR
jgi:phosphoglycolate phosphatase